MDANGHATEWGLEDEPPRHDYRLTLKGREVLHEWSGLMAERRRIIKPFLDRIEEDIEDLSPLHGGPSGG